MEWSAQNLGLDLTRREVLCAALSFLIPSTPLEAAARENFMEQMRLGFGNRNPKAPEALSHFAFLIGQFKCEAKLKSSDGSWQMFHATWSGRFILDGYAIADEYTMTGPEGELVVLGMNFRTYDVAKQVWNIKWLNALGGSWTDLGSEEFGGVKIAGNSITYSFKEPVAVQAYTRATYTNISPEHFTWKGERSDDGKSWTDFMLVECHRARE
jgi:hypothetical protein